MSYRFVRMTPGPRPMTALDAGEPRTAAGKALLAELRRDVHWFIGGSQAKELAYITAIEDEAREPLDAAWRDAEAALPEGYSVGVTKTVKVASGPYVATTDFGPAEHGYAYGPTPAVALLALAAALRKPVTA